MKPKKITEDLDKLLEVLPPAVQKALDSSSSREDLLEVVLDLGRLPEARYPGRTADAAAQQSRRRPPAQHTMASAVQRWQADRMRATHWASARAEPGADRLGLSRAHADRSQPRPVRHTR